MYYLPSARFFNGNIPFLFWQMLSRGPNEVFFAVVLPAGQFSHFPRMADLPMGHVSQVIKSLDDTLPFGHDKHEPTVPSGAYFPDVQSRQFCATETILPPPIFASPGGHVLHEMTDTLYPHAFVAPSEVNDHLTSATLNMS